jgi:hypothetical protein
MRRILNPWLAVFVVLLCVAWVTPASAGETRGKVMEVHPDKLEFVIADSTGERTVFQMDEDAQVLINGKQAQLRDLRPGDVVVIAGRRDGDNWMAIEVRCQRK